MKIRIPKIIHEFLIPIVNRWAHQKSNVLSRNFRVTETHKKGWFVNRKFFIQSKEVA